MKWQTVLYRAKQDRFQRVPNAAAMPLGKGLVPSFIPKEKQNRRPPASGTPGPPQGPDGQEGLSVTRQSASADRQLPLSNRNPATRTLRPSLEGGKEDMPHSDRTLMWKRGGHAKRVNARKLEQIMERMATGKIPWANGGL